MLKTVLPYFLLAVTLVLLFFLFQANREIKKLKVLVNSKAQEVIEANQAQIKAGDSLIQRIRAKVGKDSLETLKVVGGLKSNIRTLRSKLAELGQITPPRGGGYDMRPPYLRISPERFGNRQAR